MSTDRSFSLSQLHRLVTSRKDAKGALRQWVEMAALFVVRGNGPGFYQMGGFWRKGQRWGTMTRHMSYRGYQTHLDRLNRKEYRKLSQNKVAEKAILTLLGIPTPRFIGLLDQGHGCTPSGAPLRNARELAAAIAGDPAARICFKLVEGHGGKGFVAAHVVRTSDVGFRLLDPCRSGESAPGSPAGRQLSDVLSADDMFARLGHGQRIIEEYVDQHPAYAALNPSSVNTLRIWVLRRDGRASTRLAFLRIGRHGSLVDNRSAGGIVVPVNIATGELSEGLDGKPRRQTYVVHPDTGAPIAGIVLPMFADAKEVAERSLTVFPYTNFAGVDVALTPAGPVVLELNVQADRSGAVHVGIPTEDVFGL